MTAPRPIHVPPRWYPLGTQRHYTDRRPPVGELIAHDRAVWRVLAVVDIELDEEDRRNLQEWRKRRADPWPRVPFRVDVEYIGGVAPTWLGRHKDGRASMTIRSSAYHGTWDVYPHGRWPKCSCCGEPMPCRAELQDLKVDAAVQKMEVMEAKLPGCCWGCGEPVTRRHKTVRYPGENLDMPGGPNVVFHIRASCFGLASTYETKWLAADPARRRVLTWPSCPSTLYWHADGSSECSGGDPECEGFTTHNHGSQGGCANMPDGCPRGCPTKDSYCNPKRLRHPDYRNPDYPQGRPGDGRHYAGAFSLGGGETDDEGDGRASCPGTLIKHLDGTAECRAGGRDDCWDGSKYRHDRSKSCQDQSCGCPTCETSEGLT